MFKKIFEYAGPYKKNMYVATVVVLVSVLMGVLPFVLAYQVISPLVMGDSVETEFVLLRVIGVLICLVLQAFFYGWGLSISHKAAYNTLFRLRVSLQEKFEKLPLGIVELPEVETSRRGIEPHLVGATILHAVVRNGRLRWPVSEEIYRLSDVPVLSVRRRAKYLLLELPDGWIIVHLGMSGSLRILSEELPAEKHDHVDLVMSNGIKSLFLHCVGEHHVFAFCSV